MILNIFLKFITIKKKKIHLFFKNNIKIRNVDLNIKEVLFKRGLKVEKDIIYYIFNT